MLALALVAALAARPTEALAPTSLRPPRPATRSAPRSSSPSPGPRSGALPWAEAPFHLDGTLPGDVGFDPLNLAAGRDLRELRAAELRHGRAAMVAMGGWPIAAVATAVATRVVPAEACSGNGCAIDATARNLPLSDIRVLAFGWWAAALATAVAAELGSSRGDAVPAGDGWDPLGLADDRTRLAELKHGRLAMVALLWSWAAKLASPSGVVFAHQVFGRVCVNNLRHGFDAGPSVCFDAATQDAGFDAVLSWEIMYRVVTGYVAEPFF